MNNTAQKRILYGRALCPFARKIILALAEKKLPFVFEMNMSDKDDQSLPVLCDLQGQMLSGYYAITEYLEEQYRDNILLLGFDPVEKAEIRRLMQWCDVVLMNNITYPFIFERVYKFLWRLGVPNYKEFVEIRKNIKNYILMADELLSQRNWFAGENLSYADLTLAAHISCLDFLGEVKWKEYDNLYEWYLKMKSRPSFMILLHEELPGMNPVSHYKEIDFDQDVL